MKPSKLFFILVLLVAITKVKAQNFELGKVSIAELQEKVNPNDTTAVAAILYNKARTFFTYNSVRGFSINTEFEIRIKIYKKEGLEWASHQVDYYVGYEKYNDDNVSYSNAVTYNLEEGKIVKTKLKNEGSFSKNINKYWSEKMITMPNVKVGSVIEYKYIFKSENIVKFPRFDFQYDIPVNYSEYKTEIPGFFVYKAVFGGLFKIENEAKIVTGALDFAKENNPTASASVSFQQVNSKYSAYAIPALKSEPFVDNLQNYRTYILHELEMTQFYDQPVKDYSSTWEGVTKTIFDDKDFAKQLNERTYLRQDLRTILKIDPNNDLSQNEKLSVIFKFVQQKMNWNGEFGYNANKGAEKAYVESTGNSAEINIILINMLKLVGINANPVLLSTRSNGLSVFPSRTAFNYLIAAAEIDGKQILLDATNKNTTINVLPLRTLNWTGRLIKPDGTSEEVNLMPKVPTIKNYSLMINVENSGKLSGKYFVRRNDYDAYVFRENYSNINQENYLEKLENDLNGTEISNYIIENSNTDLSKPVVERFDFATSNQCEIIGGKMYIKPLLFFTQTRNPFKLEKRQMPICFDYPKQEQYNINYVIPAGYVVESIPKPMRIATADDEAVFSINTSTADDKIQIVIKNEINGAVFSADFYTSLKAYFQKIIDKQNEKIVLKKI